ncbi:BEM_collapsed_G0053170.mRNA.1.CDS.1 [Saccharomyces cerevisiae]|nr:BEM_HP_G0010250.mRNA.1.CDS.1 [Saccharomyces cerevisiae]CAI5017291.1 BEM_HP_G0026190.mRNA.1.CDS.1 [Saccharomyces cerevisiae]CAI5077159.1 BEM_HP_G0055150.mRNA.1.CDS.1 [Saccharomyces cerevisiae]CAI5206616.1 BEM_HP_G0108500.mRNA.1.CDS.1 [Saccharomyces cerevisiae]CAI6894054.1 BEM_HP_G0010250.mRNA.1.CDS.1 [Saccharomyces cerevisiae]
MAKSKSNQGASGARRKPAPSLYQHISSFKPQFSTRVDDVLHFSKTLTWRSEIIPDKSKGTLTTSLLYSQGSDIYEIDTTLPLKTFYDDDDDDDNDDDDEEGNGKTKSAATPNPEYGDAFQDVEGKPLRAKWIYQGETVAKMQYLESSDDSTAIAMSKNGSLAWFRDEIKVPVHIVQEMMGPATRYSSIHSLTRPGSLAVSDFDVSTNMDTVVKSQSNGYEEDSILKIIDNSDRPGDILRTVHVPGTNVAHSVRFFNNHLFASCSDDNILRFWDTRTADKPLWTLSEPKNGRLTSFDSSQVTENLFVTGFSTGVIKLWDARAVQLATTDLTHRQNGEEPIQNEIAKLFHSGGDSVVDILFSQTSATEFVTVGGTGNVYHWDMEYSFSRNDDDNEDEVRVAAPEELQGQCLKFFHTGGTRRSSNQFGKRNTVALHPVINDFVGTVDSDSLVTAYKPFLASDFIGRGYDD